MDDVKQEAHAIFRAALDLETGERSAYVDETCGARGPLRSEVDALVASLGESEHFLETPALVTIDRVTMEATDRARLGHRLGRYRVESVIATGGMGVVYRAEQESPKRTVALKVMRTGFATPTAMRRFETETETLARLRHPGIAQIYEAGTDRQGTIDVPWFALEYVEEARDLISDAAARDLTDRAKIAMFLDVCDAVHHANLRGVVHRDLKPANLLVDQTGRVKVIDFGVSQLADGEATAVSFLTAGDHLIGTLPWMSPEQCVPGRRDLDLRCDVYALGVVLYELLTGRRPYDLTELPIHEATKVICEQPPIRPSAIDPELGGDLETIMLTALEKDRERRYASADALAVDLRRTLSREPIHARPATRSYRLRLFLQRHRTLSLATATVVATLLFATVLASWLAVTANRERDRSLWQAYLGAIAGAQAARDAGELDYLSTKLATAPAEHRGWEWSYLARDVSDRDQELYRHETMIVRGALSLDGTMVVNCDKANMVTVVDSADGRVISQWGTTVLPRDVAFFPDGSRVATGMTDGTVDVNDIASGNTVLAVKVGMGAIRVGVSPDGKWMACGDRRGKLVVLDVATGAIVTTVDAHDAAIVDMVFSNDGRDLLSCANDDLIKVWRQASDGLSLTNRLTLRGHEDEVRVVATDREDTVVVSGAMDGTARVWSLIDGTEVAHYQGPADTEIWAVACADDGLVAVGYLRAIDLWDWRSGTTVLSLRGHSDLPAMVGFLKHEATLISSSWDCSVLRWDLRVGRLRGVQAHDDLIQDVVFSPDGRRLYSAAADGFVKVWEVATGDELAVLTPGVGGGDQRALAVSPDGKLLAVGDSRGDVEVFATADGQSRGRWVAHSGWVTRLAFHPDGDRLVSTGHDGTVRVTDVGGTLVVELDEHDDTVRALAFSPDGTIMATGSWDDRVILWRVSDWSVIRTLEEHTFDVYALAWNSDGSLLASGSRDRVIIVWDREGNVVAHRAGHGQFITDLAFHPTEQRLASAGWFGPVRLWDAEHFESLLPLSAHRGSVRTLAWSPDGSILVSGGDDGRIQFWDRTPGAVVRDRAAMARDQAANE